MLLEIQSYGVELLEGMCAAYNQMTVAEPDIDPLSPDHFESFIAAKNYFDPQGMGIVTEGDGGVLMAEAFGDGPEGCASRQEH